MEFIEWNIHWVGKVALKSLGTASNLHLEDILPNFWAWLKILNYQHMCTIKGNDACAEKTTRKSKNVSDDLNAKKAGRKV